MLWASLAAVVMRCCLCADLLRTAAPALRPYCWLLSLCARYPCCCCCAGCQQKDAAPQQDMVPHPAQPPAVTLQAVSHGLAMTQGLLAATSVVHRPKTESVGCWGAGKLAELSELPEGKISHNRLAMINGMPPSPLALSTPLDDRLVQIQTCVRAKCEASPQDDVPRAHRSNLLIEVLHSLSHPCIQSLLGRQQQQQQY